MCRSMDWKEIVQDYIIKFFGFASQKGESRLEEAVLNRPLFLKMFATYFKRKMSSVLLRMQEEAGSLVDLKGKDFFQKDPVHPNPNLDALLEDLGQEPLLKLAAKLSPQEKKCLRGSVLDSPPKRPPRILTSRTGRWNSTLKTSRTSSPARANRSYSTWRKSSSISAFYRNRYGIS